MALAEVTKIKTKGIHNIFSEIESEKFLNLRNNIVIQIQDSFRTPNGQYQKGLSPRHIIIKMSNIWNKNGIFKSARGKCQVIFKGKSTRLSSDLYYFLMINCRLYEMAGREDGGGHLCHKRGERSWNRGEVMKQKTSIPDSMIYGDREAKTDQQQGYC